MKSKKKSRVPESNSREQEAVEALTELGETLKEKGIILDQWIESSRRIRGQMIKEQYPDLKATKRRRGQPRYPDWESLQGAAGKLKRPMSWKRIKAIIRDERAEKVLQVLNGSRGK
jgi:CopG antitoxin of type II toxin-antitoxin system